MSTVSQPSEDRMLVDLQGASSSAAPPAKSKRVLACILCQQRKVKCDRQFPCSNCVKSRVPCVPGSQIQRRRKRRFPERQLLERLRKYEDLLRQHNVPFEPLHKGAAEDKDQANAESGDDSVDELPDAIESDPLRAPGPSGINRDTRTIWNTMSRGYQDEDAESESSRDGLREAGIKRYWEGTVRDDDHLLFGPRVTTVDLHTLHPDPVKIFRLWQIYLDNVNPLLRVIHTPSLQGLVIEAASDVKRVTPELGALLFGIYCTAILSLTVEDCKTIFGDSKDDLLSRYQFGCQQALLQCGVLRSNDRDCLTAFFLYLISVRASTAPKSLSPIIGVAIRIAERMGLHLEAVLVKSSVLEAEMRRRLWWALVIFDKRIGELGQSKSSTLDPTWDCKVPLNVNDSDLRPEMKEPPLAHGKTSDTLFAVVRAELGDFTRFSAYHLDYHNPALKVLRKAPIPEDGEMGKLEATIEEKYFRYCDADNPIHFMTMWTSRSYLAKCRLMEHNLGYTDPSIRRTVTYRDFATGYAMRVLECDTHIMTSPLTKGFLWLNHFNFPFPAYIQIVQDLRRRPSMERASQAWDSMSDNYEAWVSQFREHFSVFQIFAKLILQAWAAYEEAVSKQTGDLPPPARLVIGVKQLLAEKATDAVGDGLDQTNNVMGMGDNDFALSMPGDMDFSSQSSPYSLPMSDNAAVMSPGMYPGMPGANLWPGQMHPLWWSALGQRPGWGGF